MSRPVLIKEKLCETLRDNNVGALQCRADRSNPRRKRQVLLTSKNHYTQDNRSATDAKNDKVNEAPCRQLCVFHNTKQQPRKKTKGELQELAQCMSIERRQLLLQEGKEKQESTHIHMYIYIYKRIHLMGVNALFPFHVLRNDSTCLGQRNPRRARSRLETHCVWENAVVRRRVATSSVLLQLS